MSRDSSSQKHDNGGLLQAIADARGQFAMAQVLSPLVVMKKCPKSASFCAWNSLGRTKMLQPPSSAELCKAALNYPTFSLVSLACSDQGNPSKRARLCHPYCHKARGNRQNCTSQIAHPLWQVSPPWRFTSNSASQNVVSQCTRIATFCCHTNRSVNCPGVGTFKTDSGLPRKK